MALEVKLFLKDHFSNTFTRVVKSLGHATMQTLKWGTALAGVFTGLAIKKASDFQDQISQIATLSDFTADELANMGSDIKKLGIESGRALSELTKARYDIISAGFTDVASSMAVMNEASKLAVAGNTSAAATADVLTSALNAYGLTAESVARISDVLFTTVKLGKTTVDELAGSLGQVMPFAKAAGVEIEGVGAAMATLTLAGLDTTIATTGLRSAFRNLSAPTKEAKKEMEAAGISVKYLEDGTMDLYETFKQFSGMSLDEITRFIPDVRASTAILSLSDNVEILRESFESMDDASGAAATAYEKRLKTFRVQWDRLLNNMNVALIDIGEKMLEEITPIVTDINDKLAKIGEIGWDNIGASVLQNLGALGKVIIETAKNIGLFAGQEIGQGIKKGFGKLFGIESEAERLKRELSELQKELKAKLEQDELTLKIRSELYEGTEFGQELEFTTKLDTHFIVAQINDTKKKLEELEESDFGTRFQEMFQEVLVDWKGLFETIVEDADKLNEKANETAGEVTTTLADWREQYVMDAQTKIRERELAEAEAAENTVNYWEQAFLQMSEKQQEHYDWATQIVGATGQLWNSFLQMRKSQIGAEYDEKKEKLADWYEREKASIERTILNEELKTEKLKSLDEDYFHKTQTIKEQQVAEEKKAAEEMKGIRIAQAIAEAALAVLNALNTKPFIPLGLAMAAVATGIGATQVATIKAQPYAEGTMNVNAPLSDTIPAVLTPGESVNTRETTSMYSSQISRLNQMASGGGKSAGSSSGGDIYNVTIHAMDSKSFETFMKENPKAFAEALRSAERTRNVKRSMIGIHPNL